MAYERASDIKVVCPCGLVDSHVPSTLSKRSLPDAFGSLLLGRDAAVGGGFAALAKPLS